MTDAANIRDWPDRDELVSLLGFYLGALPARWQTLQSYINLYFTLCVALLTASLSILAVVHDSPMVITGLVGPIMVWQACKYARITIVKQNKHIKELIVIIGKLEYEIGLYHPWHEPGAQDRPWNKDCNTLPSAWIQGRERYDNSDEFVNSFQDSTAKAAAESFGYFQVITIVLSIAIILAFFANWDVPSFDWIRTLLEWFPDADLR